MMEVEPIDPRKATRHDTTMFCVGFIRTKCSTQVLSLICLSGIVSCQPQQRAQNAQGSAAEQGLAAEQGSAPETSPEGTESAAPASESGKPAGPQGASTEAVSNRLKLEDNREPDPSKSLPELSFSHLGMHIGGESNSPESKRPWFKGIEAGQDDLLRCYRYVEEPESGGSYGVDLYVGRSGGAPEVRGSRQKIGGEKFDACMKQAFEKLNFQKPERPTVLSYSLLFSLGDK